MAVPQQTQKLAARTPGAHPADEERLTKPSVIVLCKVVTGLATVRALAEQGLDVHAFIFSESDPLLWSRYATKVKVHHLAGDEAALIAHLKEYAAGFKTPPVVLPTCDALTLALARHRDSLQSVCQTSTTPLELMQSLVHKEKLYEAAQQGDIPTIPFLFSPSLDELEAWMAMNDGPYLAKPSFESARNSRLTTKNRILADRGALRRLAGTQGLHAIVVQQLKLGGDGEIYDTYGCSDARGHVLSISSHRRLRQQRPDLGSTCFGEIPAGLARHEEEQIFELTRRLLGILPYHGIFGIEWLRDTSSGRFYLIDFNARAFLCIGHLKDCGVNLPEIAYLDLAQAALTPPPPVPKVKRKVWIDLKRDLQARRTREGVRRLHTFDWLVTLLQASSFAYWDWRDPAPWLFSVAQLGLDAVGSLEKIFF